MSIESLFHEAVPNEPFIRPALQPYEIKRRDGNFVACLPVAGRVDASGKARAEVFSEKVFDTEEEAYQAVAEARKAFELAQLN